MTKLKLRSTAWNAIPLSLRELSIDTTLRCGQSFRWRRDGDEWSCALYGRVYTLRQRKDTETLEWKVALPHSRKPAISDSVSRSLSKATSKPRKAIKKEITHTSLLPTPPPSSPQSQAQSLGDGTASEVDFDSTQDTADNLSSSELFLRKVIKSEETDIPLTSIPHEGQNSIEDSTDSLSRILHYLNLPPYGPSLPALYDKWSAADKNFARHAPSFSGIRILRQPPFEALIGFICSSNNNIARISQMLNKLCIEYGEFLGMGSDGKPWHDFPRVETLAQRGVEARLRELGFGYRARYVWETAVVIMERGIEWLEHLAHPKAIYEKAVSSTDQKTSDSDHLAWTNGARAGYWNAHENLLALCGVGPKVSDCVALFGLGWLEAIPVDTHVLQIATRDYRLRIPKSASLTKQTYDLIGNTFREIWGKEAGWAHSVLFTADLRAFAGQVQPRQKTKVTVQKIEKTEESTDDESTDEIQTTITVSAKTLANNVARSERAARRSDCLHDSHKTTVVVEKRESKMELSNMDDAPPAKRRRQQ